MKRENVWRKKLEAEILACYTDVEILKMHVGVMDSAGKPDLFVTQKELGGVWLELKYVADGRFDWKKVTPLQKDLLRRLYYAGQRVGVIVFFEQEWRSIHGENLIIAMGSGGTWTRYSPCWASNNDAFSMTRFVWGS